MSDDLAPAALRAWQELRGAVAAQHAVDAGGGSAVAGPAALLAASAEATRALSAAAAHAVLRPLLGWRPPADLSDVAADLAGLLPSESALVAPPPSGGPHTRALLGVLDVHPVVLSSFYEALLTGDWRTGTTTHQHARRSLGAFHTPRTLARAVVARTADVMVADRLGSCAPDDPARARLLAGLRVADLAVGTGRFPVAWLHHLGRLPGGAPLLVDAVRGLELTDADPVALELAGVACAVAANEPGLLRPGAGPVLRWGNALLVRPPGVDPAAPREPGHLWDPAAGVPAGESDLDLVLGNPPWERVRVEERTLLRGLLDAVAGEDRRAARDDALARSAVTHPEVTALLDGVRASTARGIAAMRTDPRLARSTVGELYTHVLFTELALHRVAARDGWASLLVKSAMLTSAGHAALASDLLDRHRIHEVWDFRNTARLFAIDSRERFALLLAGPPTADAVGFAAGLTRAEELGDTRLLAPVDDALRRRLDPATGLLPAAGTGDLPLQLRLTAHPTLGEAHPDAHFGRLLHLTNHSAGIHRAPGSGRLPVWEGRMLEQYTARHATFAGVDPAVRWSAKVRARPVTPDERADPHYRPQARWWCEAELWERVAARHREAFSLVWRNASSPYNRRTVLATVLPRVPTTQSVQLLQLPDPLRLLVLCGVLNSVPFDWLVRRRMPGIDVTGTLLRGVPVPGPAAWAAVRTFDGLTAPLDAHVAHRVGTLLADDGSVHPLLEQALGAVPAVAPCGRWVRRQLDVLVAAAYGLSGEELAALATDVPADVPEAERAALRDGDYGAVEPVSEGSASASRLR